MVFDPVYAVRVEDELVGVRVVDNRLGAGRRVLALLRDHFVNDPV